MLYKIICGLWKKVQIYRSLTKILYYLPYSKCSINVHWQILFNFCVKTKPKYKYYHVQIVLFPYLSDYLYIAVWKMKRLNISRYVNMKRHYYE